jgi:hypothetical protein
MMSMRLEKLRRVDLKLLIAFAAIAEEKSVTTAASVARRKMTSWKQLLTDGNVLMLTGLHPVKEVVGPRCVVGESPVPEPGEIGKSRVDLNCLKSE